MKAKSKQTFANDGIDQRDGEQLDLATVVYRFTVLGAPRTNERSRIGRGANGRPRSYTPAKTALARAEVIAAFQAVAAGWKPHEGPVRLQLIVEHAAPADKRWKGRFCRQKPDLDNVCKLVSDALNGVAYLDDAQIVELTATKSYASQSAIHVVLSFDEEEEKPPHGLVPLIEGCSWGVWDRGQDLGLIYRVGSTLYGAADSNSAPVHNPATKNGYWPSRAAARRAVEMASGQRDGVQQ